MPGQSHISRALEGAVTLARFDRKGMGQFDFSYDGFWRSFNAMAVALPIVIASAALTPSVYRQLGEFQPDASAPQVLVPQNVPLFTLTETVSFFAGWLFFPLAMIWLARFLRVGERYVPLIVAWNWSRAISAWVALTPIVLCGLGILGVGFYFLIQLLVVLFVAAYRWFVIRTATGLAGTTAFGLLMFDLVGGYLVETPFRLIYGLFGSTLPAVPGNT